MVRTVAIPQFRSMFRKSDEERLALKPNVVIEEVLALLHGDLQRRGISVETRLHPGIPEIEANRVQLQQVILNLLVNAAEAMDSVTDRARILKITLNRKEPSDILITVEDSGPSLESKDIERIFEPFYSTKPAGMGLGLAICRSIVEAHGGRMFATPGRWYGLAVHISMPATVIGAVQKVGGGVADAVSA